MRQWLWPVTIGVFAGLLAAALIFLTCSPPRGVAVSLLPPPTPAPMLVHVTGAVVQPGIYALAPGARVRDALAAAGGLLPEANLGNLNQAAPLQDGQQVAISAQGAAAPGAAAQPVAANLPQQTPVAGSDATTPPGELININTATQEELETLPGIGPVTAAKIIAHRAANGPFAAVENILDVPGIGEKTFAQIQALITVGAAPGGAP